MDLSQSAVCQVLVPVDDLERAIAFYRDTLGLPLLFTAPPQMSFFQCGAVRLLVGVPPADQPRHRVPALYMQVADIHAVHAELTRRGIAFSGAPHIVHRTEADDIWLADFQDPDGNQLAVMAQMPKGTSAA